MNSFVCRQPLDSFAADMLSALASYTTPDHSRYQSTLRSTAPPLPPPPAPLNTNIPSFSWDEMTMSDTTPEPSTSPTGLYKGTDGPFASAFSVPKRRLEEEEEEGEDEETTTKRRCLTEETREKGGFDAALCEALFMKYHCMEPEPFEAPGGEMRWICGRGLEELKKDVGWRGRGGSGVAAFFFILRMQYLTLISEAEWMRAFSLLDCSTFTEARHRSTLLHYQMIKHRDLHQQYLCFAFYFFKGRESKLLNRQDAVHLLHVIVGGVSAFTGTFCAFLEHAGITHVNADQWKAFLAFSVETDPGLHNHCFHDAWPTLYDDYVQWMRDYKTLLNPGSRTGF